MFKVVNIGECEVPMLANGATPYRYKQLYGADLMKAFSNLTQGNESEGLDVVVRLAYVMAMAAKKEDMNRLNEEGFYSWLEQFENNELISAAEQIISVYLGQNKSTSKSKNQASRQKGK